MSGGDPKPHNSTAPWARLRLVLSPSHPHPRPLLSPIPPTTACQTSRSEATPRSSPFPPWIHIPTHRFLAGKLGYTPRPRTLARPCPPHRSLCRVLRARSTGGRAGISCLGSSDMDTKAEVQVRRDDGRWQCWKEMVCDMVVSSYGRGWHLGRAGE